MRLRKFVVALALTLFATVSYGENWPTWRGPRGDGISQEKDLIQTWPEGGPKLAWTAKVGEGYSTPIAVDGKLYIFTLKEGKEVLTCLDAATGKSVWTQSYGPGRTGGFPGTRATPTLEGNVLYTFGANGMLLAVKAGDGQEIWRVDVLKETGGKNIGWGTSSSPLVLDKDVIVQGSDGGSIAVAVDKETGKIKWLAEKGIGSYAAPTLIEVEGVKQVIILGGAKAYALAPETGKQIWSLLFQTQYNVNASTPIYRDHMLFISSGYNHGSQMIKVTATSAAKSWPEENKIVMAKFPSSILDGDVMYANSEGTLKCVSWPECQLKWESKGFNLGSGGSFVRVDDKLILLGETGVASLAQATAAGVTPLSQFTAFPKGKEIWTLPLIYSGNLYLKGGDELKCYTISAK